MRKEKGRFWTKYNKVQQAEPTEVVSNLDGSLYAVLFNADKGVYSPDIEIAHKYLIKAGVPNSDIFCLEGQGETNKKFLTIPATIKSLDSVIDVIRQKANNNDELLVFVTNHGAIHEGQAYFLTHENIGLLEKDFESMMQDIPVNFSLFYFSQCHSGGFAERMGCGRNIGLSTSANQENTGSMGGQFYTKNLFKRLLNDDVSIETAFDKANSHVAILPYRLNDVYVNPQLRWQNADPSQLYLGSTSPSKK